MCIVMVSVAIAFVGWGYLNGNISGGNALGALGLIALMGVGLWWVFRGRFR